MDHLATINILRLTGIEIVVIVSVMINEIVDDELLLVNAIVNDKNLDDVDDEE